MDKCDLLLIDGKNLLFRVGHTFRDLTYKDESGREMSIGAVYGFLRVLASIHSHWGGIPIICWECRREDNFRREIYSEYKTKEDGKIETEYWVESIRIQLIRLQKILSGLGIKQAYSERHEADDVMATLAKRFAGPETEVVIYTNDADLFQAVQDHVTLVQPKKKGEDVWTVERVKVDQGIEPGQHFDIKALTGCNSDNVPGVRGIGPKRAMQLITEFGTVDKVLECSTNAHYVKHQLWRYLYMVGGSKDIVERAKLLVKIHDNVKIKWMPARRDLNAIRQLIVRRWGFKHFASPNKFGDLSNMGVKDDIA